MCSPIIPVDHNRHLTWHMIFIIVEFRYSLDDALPVIVILVTYWVLFFQTMLSFNFCLFQCIIYWYYSMFTPDMHVQRSLILHSYLEELWSMVVTFCWSGIWGGAHAFRRAGVLFAWSSNLGISSCLLSFLLIFPMILYSSDSIFILLVYS